MVHDTLRLFATFTLTILYTITVNDTGGAKVVSQQTVGSK